MQLVILPFALIRISVRPFDQTIPVWKAIHPFAGINSAIGVPGGSLSVRAAILPLAFIFASVRELAGTVSVIGTV